MLGLAAGALRERQEADTIALEGGTAWRRVSVTSESGEYNLTARLPCAERISVVRMVTFVRVIRSVRPTRIVIIIDYNDTSVSVHPLLTQARGHRPPSAAAAAAAAHNDSSVHYSCQGDAHHWAASVLQWTAPVGSCQNGTVVLLTKETIFQFS